MFHLKAVDASWMLPTAQRDKPDVILLDINIPGGKGSDILIELKRSSLTPSIQVIVLTDLKTDQHPL